MDGWLGKRLGGGKSAGWVDERTEGLKSPYKNFTCNFTYDINISHVNCFNS